MKVEGNLAKAVILLVFAVGIPVFYLVFVEVDITDEDILNGALAFTTTFLVATLVAGYLWGREGFLNSLWILISILLLAGFIYLVYEFYPVFLNFPAYALLLLIPGVFLIGVSLYLAMNQKKSKISDQPSFLLGGTLLFLGVVLSVLGGIFLATGLM
ncbi:MAG: hypothetical protein ACTSU5_06950 [Promethearchaeota archaeon]